MTEAIHAQPNYRFYVMIEGIPKAVFTEASGLQIETEILEYAEGGNNSFVHRLPGRTKFSNLTLKRGMTSTNEFFRWYVQIMHGKNERRNLAVVMYDPKGEEILRWNFINAYPVKWVGPQLSAGGNAIAVETLEIAHEGLSIG
jgi:phage tail-like protein